MSHSFLKNSIKAIVVAVLFLPFSAFAINTIATGFQVDAANPYEINAFSVCKVARSLNGNTYFIPTKTSTEWSEVRSKHNTSEIEMYDCSLPASQCRVGYQYKIDNKIGSVKYTPYSNNTNTYVSGTYSIVKTGKDDHCNGSQACGIRGAVQCVGDYGIRVTYQMQFEGVNGASVTTAWSNVSTAFGAWSQRQYETGDSECSAAAGCKIRMTIEDDHPDVTCSIGYQHRDEQSQSGWAYDNAWATITSSGSEGENCEGAGCGLQVRVYCEAPPEGLNAPAGGGGVVNGECGVADGAIYDGGSTGQNPPSVADRCSAGSVSNFVYDNDGQWTWSCLGSGGGTNDFCSAFNADHNWNPPGDPDFGEGGCENGEICFNL